jgi:hypothetical protein
LKEARKTLIRRLAFSALAALAVYGCRSSGDGAKAPNAEPDAGAAAGIMDNYGVTEPYYFPAFAGFVSAPP